MPSTQLPLTLYVHLPWCVRKCPYCDFNSHAGQPEEQRYVDALIRDLDFELQSRSQWPRVRAIFFGGGTPSLFSGDAIARILDALQQRLNITPDTEITLEANPGTADAAHFAGYRQAGVNRLSIGVQSFDDEQLRKLGRIHSARSALDAYTLARDGGFDNINLDLMHGLPGQQFEHALSDLDQALELSPEHISWYQLTIEDNTAFAQHPPQLPDNDAQADIEEAGLKRMRQAGFVRYEVSAFAQRGRRAAHNLNYWRFGDYLGIGAGAHGKLSFAHGVRRRARLRSPQKYMAGAGSRAALARESWPDSRELISEFALNTLRIDGAFSRSRFERTTGLNFALLTPALDEACALGLVRRRENQIVRTALGRRHLNRLLECFAELSAFQ